MNLNTFKEEQSKLSKALEKHSRGMLVEEFKNFFTENPNVVAVRWTQYTPHFNDGDVCEFGRHDFDVSGQFSDELSKDAYPEDDNEQYYSSYSFKANSEVRKALKKLDSTFNNTDDVFRATFGDGVQVTATRTGFEVEDYDHD